MRKKTNPDSEANIRRIDTKPKATKQTHGFQVHLSRGERTVNRLFSDATFGGKEGARRAARKFRREMLSDLPERVFRGPVPAAKAALKSPGKKAVASKSAKTAKKTRGR